MEASAPPGPGASRRDTAARRSHRSGWVMFAGVMMLIVGSLDVIWGIAAIANNEIVIVGGHGALILDITTWGWI